MLVSRDRQVVQHGNIGTLLLMILAFSSILFPFPGTSHANTPRDPLTRLAQSPTQVSALDVRSVNFEPAKPIAGDKLTVSVEWKSPPTMPVFYYYRWKVNGEVVHEWEKPELQFPLKRDDLVEVIVFIGEDRSESRAVGNTVKVENALPEIKRAAENLNDGNRYTARFEVSDRDGEEVTLSLQKGPEGMQLDEKTREITWSLPTGAQGTYPVELTARDAYGAKVLYDYSINLRQEQQPAGSKSDDAKPVTPPPPSK